MKILVVGSGGVGAAFAPIAARRDFYEHIVFADIDERARAARRGSLRGARAVQRGDGRCDRSRPGGGSRACERRRRDPERRRPAVRDAGVRGRAGGGRATTWTWRCRCRSPIPSARTKRWARSWATTSSRCRTSGSSGAGSPSWASGSSPAPPTCSRSTRRSISSRGSTRWGFATARTSRSPVTRSPPRSRSGRRSRSASTRR